MLEVRGVHPVAAEEPVHLIDVAISGRFEDVDWGSITQKDESLPRENWQVPYDEQEQDPLPDGRARAVFFFHYLNLSGPLDGPFGSIILPGVTPRPADLVLIEYEEPC